MSLVLLRHGESTWNESRQVQGQSDSARLTPRGHEQAHEAALALCEYDVTLIIASDLARARETAEIVGKVLGLTVLTSPALRERSFGTFEGGPLGGLPSSESGIADRHVIDASVHPSGGESLDELYGRVGVFLEEIRTLHEGARPLLVTHGGTIRALRAYCDGTAMSDVEWDPVTNCSIWRAELASVWR